MDIDLGGSKITYDSTNANAPQNALGDFFKAALVGSGVQADPQHAQGYKADHRHPKVRRPRRLALKKLDGRQPADEAAAGPDPERGRAETNGRSHLRRSCPILRKAKGDTWKATSVLDMGPIGKYDNTFTYTYDGKNADATADAEKKWDRIKVATELKYTPPDEKTYRPAVCRSPHQERPT